jgi:hypothetical protein
VNRRNLAQMIAAAHDQVNLNLTIQDEDWILIEGDRKSLAFVGELLLAYSEADGPAMLTLDGDPPMFRSGSFGICVCRRP